jgi:beta-lactamase regulating signal transducer with metallopeptidase domain
MLRAVIEAVCNAVFWGIVLAALVWCLQALTPRTNAGTRYAVWFFTLAAVVLLPVLILCAHHPVDASDALPGRRASATQFQPATHQPGESSPPLSQDFVYLFTAFWACGSLLMLARLGWSAWRLDRLLRAAAPRPCPAGIPIYSSTDIASPMAGGVISPAILLPAVLEPRLSEAEREHVILHETAHIRRHDPWTNLAQKLAEALFFFHPAVWWIGRQMRFEREIACDDWVVAATGHAKPYAAALTRLAELTAFRRGPILATAAAANRRQLSRRIEMLLEGGRNRSPHPEQFGIMAAACLLIAAVLCCASAPSIFAFSGSESSHARQVEICRSNFWSSFTLKSRGDIEFA